MDFYSHIKCSKNFLCQNINCLYKHSVSPKKRLIIQDIIKKKNCFNINIQCCKLPITCYNPTCLLSHYVDYEHRMIINAIIKIKSDIEAEAIYCRQFVTKQCDINPSDIDNYMIVPKNTELQDTIKNKLNARVIFFNRYIIISC